MPASFDIGDAIALRWKVYAADGVTPMAATVSLTVTRPDATTSTPAVVNDSLGNYSASFTATTAGEHGYRWTAAGAATAVEDGVFTVRPAASKVIALQDVRARLNKSLTVDDDELQSMIDAAVAEYEEWVGPVGTRTLRYEGGGTRLILPTTATAVTAVAYTDGTTVTLADLDFDSDTGLLGWGYSTVGSFTAGNRNVLVTFTAALPANHREAILADVAGYFAATQRGGGAGPSFSSEGYELPLQTTPQTLFPRIRAIAAAYPSVA